MKWWKIQYRHVLRRKNRWKLLKYVKGTGKKNEVKEVSDGYARNYLLPKKLAVPADNTNMKELNEKNKSKELKAQNDYEAAVELGK